MAEHVIIPLKTPIKGPNGLSIPNVILREPTFDDVMELGDPYMIAVTQSKVPFQVENTEVIKAYLAICLVEPKDPALLKQIGAAKAIEIKDRLLAFFQPDAKGDRGIEDAADDLAFECGIDADAVGRLTISKLIYWHARAVQRDEERRKRRARKK